MARPRSESELNQLADIVRQNPNGLRRSDIAAVLPNVPQRTLQYWLKTLVDAGQLRQEGKGTAARYLPPEPIALGDEETPKPSAPMETLEEVVVPLSEESRKIQTYLRKATAARTAVGYSRDFLEGYRPNETFYLSANERNHLADLGNTKRGVEAAGTYAKHILNRLLIDLSWNSSRLEGNTYSLLDTRRLIEFGQEAKDGDRTEAQMILNHKDAIAFLVSAAEEIGFNRYTILNLHGILAQNLLADEGAPGRLRRIAVGIEGSAFHPLETPQLIDECFNQILATAQAIRDPFEQSFFAMVQFPYLQPFDDVNKRVSRLAANIPFIKNNLAPLAFTDVPRSTYTDAILGVYELNKVDLLKDVFIWAYSRSAERYAAVRQSLGEPDPFRQKHREALRHLLADVIRQTMDRKAAAAHITEWAVDNIDANERDQFREMSELDLLNLHEGNFARLQIRPSEFAAWQIVWQNKELLFPNPNERYNSDRQAVEFNGIDRGRQIRCAVSQEALHDHFGGDNRNQLDVFRENRPAIEEVAQRKYLTEQVEPDGTVVIRTADVPD